MTPYARCLATIRGERPDRVPCFTTAIACDVSSRLLGREATTGAQSLWYTEALAWMRGEQAHAEFEARLYEDLLAVSRLLGFDIFYGVWRRTARPSRQIDERTFLYGDPNGVHSVWKWDPDSMNFFPITNTAPRPAPEDWPALAKKAAADLEANLTRWRTTIGIREQALQARFGEDLFVIAPGCDLTLGTDEASLMACALEPAAVADILDCRLEEALVMAETLAARGIKAVKAGGDMADKNGPLYAPEVFRDLMLPRARKLAARCRELDLHYIWRTDGKLWPVMDLIFREAGFPGYGEVDRDAGMTVAAVRERFPSLVQWGNVSVDRVRRGSAGEVYEHAMQILEESGGVRYMHGPSNAILPGSPAENVLAVFRARDDYARNPGRLHPR